MMKKVKVYFCIGQIWLVNKSVAITLNKFVREIKWKEGK